MKFSSYFPFLDFRFIRDHELKISHFQSTQNYYVLLPNMNKTLSFSIWSIYNKINKGYTTQQVKCGINHKVMTFPTLCSKDI